MDIALRVGCWVIVSARCYECFANDLGNKHVSRRLRESTVTEYLVRIFFNILPNHLLADCDTIN